MTNERPTPDFELVKQDGVWVAVHAETGVASHGQTPTEAVEIADEAARLHQDEHTPGDDEFQQRMLDRFDIDLDW